MKKEERKKQAEETKKKILDYLHEYEKETEIFFDLTYHTLKTKEEKAKYLIYKYKLKKPFEILDEAAENPEKLNKPKAIPYVKR